MNFFLTRILPWLLVAVFGVFLWLSIFGGEKEDPEKTPGTTIITHHMVVDKIESLGKLELTHFYLKDIVEHKEVKEWYHFKDDQEILIISGEVIGCIDLTKIDTSKIQIYQDSISVTLPLPEICSYKINHKESKVYYIKTSTWNSVEDDAAFIDKGYKMAEEELMHSALMMDIYGQTRANAKLILKPLLENLTGKKVIVKVEESPKPEYPFELLK